MFTSYLPNHRPVTLACSTLLCIAALGASTAHAQPIAQPAAQPAAQPVAQPIQPTTPQLAQPTSEPITQPLPTAYGPRAYPTNSADPFASRDTGMNSPGLFITGTAFTSVGVLYAVGGAINAAEAAADEDRCRTNYPSDDCDDITAAIVNIALFSSAVVHGLIGIPMMIAGGVPASSEPDEAAPEPTRLSAIPTVNIGPASGELTWTF